ncbi:MAG: cobalamin B12-binding domain-containing protein [Alphaproteobacteria bacterium]|nr:cobalamin B12-binding domain-containing protein [Alphaproteobacteria bacterium]
MPVIRATVDVDRRPIDQRVVNPNREQRRWDAPPALSVPLMRTIEAEVIPRLLLMHGTGAAAPRTGSAILPADVETLVTHLLVAPPGEVDLCLAEIRGRGADDETVLLDLLAPSARLLGVMWERDLCDFTDVTVALNQLQRLLHGISCDLDPFEGPMPVGPSVMLSATPGEQHTFGTSVVSEFYRRAGWSVCEEMPRTEREIVLCAKKRWFSVVGFSLSGELLIDQLASVIRGVRKSSRNRDVGIIVGGPVFQDHPDWVAYVGADASALDGRDAVIQSLSLLQLLARPTF